MISPNQTQVGKSNTLSQRGHSPVSDISEALQASSHSLPLAWASQSIQHLPLGPTLICSAPTGLQAPEPHSLGGSVGLGGMLGGAVVRGAPGSLEGHGAERTFVEDLAVPLLDVAFQQGQGQVDNPTVDAPG